MTFQRPTCSVRLAVLLPPVMWPASWAMTPITWFGVSAWVSAPVWMKTLRPSSTKALKLSLLTMRTATRPSPKPAALKIGRA